MRRAPWLSYLLSVGLVLGLLIVPPTTASAQDAEVTATDEVTVSDTAGLREALTGDLPVIKLVGGTTFVLDGEPLLVSRPVTITGAFAPPGPDSTTIDANGLSRVLDLTSSATDVTIEGVVITGGQTPAKPPKNASGGGIRVASGASLRLVQSTVTGNSALDGGGILNEGNLEVVQSTIDSNIATGKGGGIRDSGSATIENTTIVGNTAAQGGGISTPGSTNITHATIVNNVAGNSSTGGVDVNGGSISLAYSIIANNVRANNNEASDCSGTPTFSGVNLISVIDGCNPDGEVVPAESFQGPVSGPTDGSIVIQGDAMAGSLASNGGPTKTVALFDESRALNAVASPCVVDTDQRGVARPGESPAVGCDLGAYERADLDAEFALAVDTSGYPDLDDGTVEVGAVSVPVDEILAEIISQDEGAVQAPDATALRSIALRSIALRSIELQDIALRSIDPQTTALRSIVVDATALRSIALRSIALRSIALRSIALRSIPLSDIPLLEEGGWEAVLSETPFDGLPLQSITLEDLQQADTPVDIDGLSLADVSLESTALRSIALRSIVLAGAALRSIPIEVTDATDETLTGNAAWCYLFDEICGDEGELTADQLGNLDLLDAQLAGASVDDVPVFDIALAGLSDLEQASEPNSTALRSIALRSIALRSIDIQSTALRSIALRSIALRSIDGTASDWIDLLVDCSADGVDCSTDVTNESTLGDVPQDALRGDVGVLLDSLAAITLACSDPGSDDAQAIGEESCAFVEGLTFGDLLLAFVAPDEPAWESLDLESALLQNIAAPLQPTFDYVATITIVDGPADLDLNLTLPQGFAAARALGETATFDGEPVEPETGDLDNLQFVIPGVGSGTHQLVVPARAGLVTGTGQCAESGAGFGCAVGTLDASRGQEGPGLLSDRVAVSVVEAARNEPSSTGTDAVPTLQLDGQLELAHIASGDDVDVFRFTVPEAQVGAQARILLSNVPADVDYDLAVYAAQQPSLRGTPTQELGLLPDKGYDLSPSDDVESTDTVEDVQLNVPEDLLGLSDYAVRDTSTKRSNEDEEVSTGALQAGDYYVAVTSFNGGLSNEPYGLRLKLDGAPELPTCAPARFDVDPSGDPLLPNSVEDGDNTVYLTNTQWLAQQLAGGEVTVENIGDAILATEGVNNVSAGILPVDGRPEVVEAYNAWNGARCDPDARNEVVRQIGLVLDDLPASVENVVIVGGDGVVPMAAVPDLTAFSNETTFAADVAFGGRTNEISGALAAGYLLTDDPYGTDAGISILTGDHELYLPELNLGRLVETGPEIVGQLERFVEFDGKLDPGGTPGALTSAVTGYDFLDDGAAAVSAELGTPAEDRLTGEGDSWTDQDFLDLLGTKQYNVLSPNAHYDYESLLPGAFDGTLFAPGDLVTTTEVNAASLVPTGALIFTMGCHAGLPIDDVQIGYSGVAVPDWAQTYGGTSNSYAAHTTYGYGDTEIVAYSERLTQIFARNISSLASGAPGAPGSVGEALRDAKAEYLQTTLVLTPYDEKILQSLTHYGLPMYDIGLGAEQATAQPGQLAAAFEAPSLISGTPVQFGEPEGPGAPTPVDIDLTLDPSLGSNPSNLNRVSTGSGDYFEVGGSVVASQFRPVQPLVQTEIPGSGQGAPAGGFLITSLDSVELDVPDELVPYYGRPILDSSDNEAVIVPGDGSFPATLQRIAPGVGTDPDRLLVAAGQLQDRVGGGGEVQRLFTHIGGELYPLDAPAGSIAEPPQIYLVDGRIDDQQPVVRFEITTDTGVDRVFILYREIAGGSAEWRGLDLGATGTTDGRTTWLGAAPISATGDSGAVVELFAQAVGANGRVGISDNKVYNYLTTLPDETSDFDLTLTCGEGCTESNGYFPGAVTAVPSGPDFQPNPEGYLFTVDNVKQYTENADGTYQGRSNEITVTGDGGHVVLAVDPDTGARAYAFFVIDATKPSLSAQQSTLVDSDTGFIVGTRVTLTASDSLSGVGSISYVVEPPVPVDDIDPACEVTSSGGPGTAQAVTCVDVTEIYLDITNPGSSTIEAWVTDKAGNEAGNETEPALIETVAVDGTAPSVSATANPSEAETSYVEGPVTVRITADDGAGSGVSAIVVDGVSTPVDPESATVTRQVSEDGETTFTYSAVDAAGNSSADKTITVKVDANAPSVSATADPSEAETSYVEGPVTVRITADDGAGSGVSAIVVDGVSTPVDPESATVTRQVSEDGETMFTYSAVDAAGNSSADKTITVKVDASAPTASVKVLGGTPLEPGEPPNFQLGETAEATYTCADATLASCRVTVDDGTPQTMTSNTGTVQLPVTSPGPHRVTVTATDAAGKRATATATYAVGYRVCEDYNYKQAKNVGSNYTIKIRLCDAAGGTVNGSFTLQATSVDGDKDPGPNSNGNSNPDYFFRGDSGGFIFNLDTSLIPGVDKGRHQLIFDVIEQRPDGTQVTSTGFARFTLR